MKLLLRRGQKSSMMGKVIFTLDLRAELSPEESSFVKKYRMGKEVVYQKVKVDTSAIPMMGAVAGWTTLVASKFMNLTLTVEDLLTGKHIECKEIMEMLAAEEQIREACQVFKKILSSAAFFEGEEVLEF